MKKIGKYRVIEELGKGGMGVVYKAHDPDIDREVAIKLILEKVLENKDVRARFIREARTAGRLSHENITIVHDLGQVDNKTYIVMEYLEGRDLRSIIDTKELIPLEQKLDYAKQICRGLQFAHSNKIIHRDIKPENIKILDNDRVKIIDFGIAKPDTAETDAGTVLTKVGMRIGTPWYMSPEQVKGIKVDRRSDIFSFGVLLYEFLTYKKPFEGDDTTVMYRILHEQPEKIEIEESGLIDELQIILLKCLEKERDARYNDCGELLRDLERVSDKARQEQRIQKLLNDGGSLAEEERFGEAIQKLKQILQIAPDHQEANKLLKKLIEQERETKNLKVLTGRISGETISHYKILERLGQGGMGVVYKAEDIKLRREVALKFLSPELIRDDEAKKRFLKEARAASALDHPNICTIYEINETEDGLMYICMAYYEGENLREKISQGDLGEVATLNTVIEVARGLARAHENGIVHRDIKPANIILTRGGKVKIVDFGLAKLARGVTVVTTSGKVMGTLYFMSPEQVKGQKQDHRTDIWSFGVMLYELFTGKLPFRGKYEAEILHAIINEEPVAPSKVKDIPVALEALIKRALKKDAQDRHASMREVLDELKDIQWQLSRKKQIQSDRIAELSRLIENGKHHFANEEFKEALTYFNAALKLEPKDRGLLNFRKECERNVRELQPLEKLLSAGKKNFQKGKYQEALKSFEAVLALQSDNPEARQFIKKIRYELEQSELVNKLIAEADAYFKQKEFSRAVKSYKNALKIDGENRKGLAGLQRAEKKLAGIAELSRLIENGKNHFNNEEFQEALTYFKAALKLEPKDQELLNFRKECERNLRELQQLDKLLSAGKKNFQKRKFQEALKSFEAVLALQSDHPEGERFIKKVRHEIEHSELASKLIKEADGYFKQKEFAPAVKAYKKAFEIDPQNRKGQAGLQRAEKKLVVEKEIDTKQPLPTKTMLIQPMGLERRSRVAMGLAAFIIVGLSIAGYFSFKSGEGDVGDISKSAAIAEQKTDPGIEAGKPPPKKQEENDDDTQKTEPPPLIASKDILPPTDEEKPVEDLESDKPEKPAITPVQLGRVLISSEPAGADVFLNGKPIGRTPFDDATLKVGSYQFLIRLDGFEEYSKQITVKAGESTLLDVPLSALLGSLNVTSEPSGAAIELDGNVVGNTPFKIEQIKPGQYQIMLSKQGYSDKTTSVDIEAGKTTPLKVQLAAFLGKIRVLVRPYGSIYVDDKLKKKDTFTPYTEELQVGQHTIRAVHPTLGTFEKYVEVQANEQVEIPFDFNQNVTVTILSQDETGKAVWAGIYIDNKYTREVTPKEAQLSPGQYKILVRRKGYSAEGGEKVINVKHGMELVKFILRRTQ